MDFCCKNPNKVLVQTVASLSAALSFFMTGLVRGYSSPATPSIQETKAHILSDYDIALIASLPASGSLVAALLSGPLLKYLGRRRTLLLTSVPWSISFLMVSFSENSKALLFAGRILMGTMVGLSVPAAQIYIAECSSPRIRGTLSSLTALFLAGGILLTYIIGALVEWNVLAWILSIFPILLLSFMLAMPESPTWLLANGKEEEARYSLKKLRGDHTDISAEWQRIYDNIKDTMHESEQRMKWKDIFHLQAIKPLGISLTLMVLQQFSGVNIIVYYTVLIFKSSGSLIDSYVATIIVGTVKFLATFLSVFLIDRLGRRILLLISGIFMAISLYAMGTYFYFLQNDTEYIMSKFGWLPLASLVVFAFSYSIGYSNVPFVVMGELFPVKFRNMSSALAAWASLTSLFVTLFTFPQLETYLGNYGAFWFYASCNTIGLLFVYGFVPETKGKTLEDIEQLFMKKYFQVNQNELLIEDCTDPNRIEKLPTVKFH